MAIPATLLTPQETAELTAAALLADAQAARLVTLRVSAIARLVRRALPTATGLVVDTSGWYYAEEHGAGSVHLLAVLNQQRTLLWAEEQLTEPAVADLPGGWIALRREVEQQLLAALDHATPALNGWFDLPDVEVDLGDLDVPTLDVQVVTLPDDAPPPQDGVDIASALERLQPLVRPLGLAVSPLRSNA